MLELAGWGQGGREAGRQGGREAGREGGRRSGRMPEAWLVNCRMGKEDIWSRSYTASSANAAYCPGDGERAPRLARRRRTVKINSEGRLSRPGVASLCGHGPRPGAAEPLERPEMVAARLAGTAEPKGSGWLPETGKGRGRPFVWRQVPAPKSPSPLGSRVDARALILHRRRSKPARFWRRSAGALSVSTRSKGLSPKLPPFASWVSLPALRPLIGSAPQFGI